MHHHTQIILFIFYRDKILLCCSDLKLLDSSKPPASACQSAVIIGISHHTWPPSYFLFLSKKYLVTESRSVTQTGVQWPNPPCRLQWLEYSSVVWSQLTANSISQVQAILTESHSVTHDGVQWHNLSSLQSLPPAFKQFSSSATRIAGTT
ncbi:hypothetical protein AAY473_030594, partial [Plecturocebus cupreus]